MNRARLCYISDNWAFFTTQDLKKQWADDWDDAPYEHNAGEPYGYHPTLDSDKEPWEILKVAYEGPFLTPRDGHTNSPFSVQMINAGAIAWLRTDSWVNPPVVIPAGTTLYDFIGLVQKAGGNVYLAADRQSVGEGE